MSKTPISTDQMLAELSLSFPALWKRPLVEFGQIGAALARGEGVWTGADSGHVMPDGVPMFNSFADGDRSYEGGVHTGFLAWLDIRGWYVESYDSETHFLVPDLPMHPEVAAERIATRVESAEAAGVFGDVGF